MSDAFNFWYSRAFDLETRMTNPGHKQDCWGAWLAALDQLRADLENTTTEFKILEECNDKTYQQPDPANMENTMTEFRILEEYDEPFTEPPVPGAEQRAYVITDVRTVDDPSKLLYHEPWYDRGTNHRVVKGYICRDLCEKLAWFVKIPDIVAFVREHGPCTFSVDFFDRPQVRFRDDG